MSSFANAFFKLFIYAIFKLIMNLGRHELLQWINNLLQTEYISIELLSDGIAYAQVLDAIHPGAVPMTRMNLNCKTPDDSVRNMKIVQDALKKLRIVQPANCQKAGKGKFQDNHTFLKWLFSYANKNGGESFTKYLPFDRRRQILDKQGKDLNDIAPHLIPNEAYIDQDQAWIGEEDNERYQQENQISQEAFVEHKISEIDAYVHHLEIDLKERMETNWKMMHVVDKSIHQRNSLYSLLQQIQKIANQAEEGPIKNHLISILTALQI